MFCFAHYMKTPSICSQTIHWLKNGLSTKDAFDFLKCLWLSLAMVVSYASRKKWHLWIRSRKVRNFIANFPLNCPCLAVENRMSRSKWLGPASKQKQVCLHGYRRASQSVYMCVRVYRLPLTHRCVWRRILFLRLRSAIGLIVISLSVLVKIHLLVELLNGKKI